MPRGDRTGPAGMGPMTGRAAGYCTGYGVPGFMNPVGGRGGGGRGWGRGGGRGWGGGWGRGGGAPAYGVPYAPPAYGVPYAPPAYGPYGAPASREDELQALREEAKYLEGALEDIKKRMGEVEAGGEG